MEKVPLHYVLGRYNPAVGEEHYGVRGIVPFFCEDKELAGYYLNEVRTMWDVEMGEEQDLYVKQTEHGNKTMGGILRQCCIK